MELFDRPEYGATAILVYLSINQGFSEDHLAEFEGLVTSADIDPVAMVGGSRKSPDSRQFVGKGKLEEIKGLIAAHKATVIVFNHELSPTQQRNLEKDLEIRVVSRTSLILDIFAKRAQSFEGKLQVELAQLQHLSTRLVKGWTHLERQKGGIGLRGGPGETQLEIDRRLIGVRIRQIKSRLSKVNKQRHQGRRSRQRAGVPTVSLVGYTNAGKSTLFNALTKAEVYSADQLFATLDPTLRQLKLPDFGEVVLADTVGFIQDLPHELVVAFRSTLQETIDADLLLHVVDASSETREEQIFEVDKVLREIGADKIPQIKVYNKIDCLDAVVAHEDLDDTGNAKAVWLSAVNGEGTDLLLKQLAQQCHPGNKRTTIKLKPAQAKLRSQLFQLAEVIEERVLDNGDVILDLNIPEKYCYLIGGIEAE